MILAYDSITMYLPIECQSSFFLWSSEFIINYRYGEVRNVYIILLFEEHNVLSLLGHVN